MTRKYIHIILLIVLFTTILLGGCKFGSGEQLENTTGNIANLGTMVKHKDKIYYTDFKNIMMIDSTGENKKEVCSGNYANLRSYGDNIYFIDGNDHLYKMNPEDKKVIPMTPEKCYFNYIIFNDSIYYTDDITGNLYKTDINCKEHKLVLEGKYGALVASGDWIYTTSFDVDKDNIVRKIYRISLDGKNKEDIGGNNSSPMLTNYLNIIGDWVYYLNSDKNICKMKLDGNDKTVINNGKCGYINVSDGWIYYSNLDEKNNLYKIKIDGTDKTLLCDFDSSYINVIDKFIIFQDDIQQKLYLIKTDGTKKTEIFS